MRLNRTMILVVLALLTVCFLGAAYALWFNPTGLPLVGANGLSTPRAQATAGAEGGSQAAHLTVTESGVVALSAEQLRTAGLVFNELSSAELNLTRSGAPVPFLVRKNRDGSTLYFYAQAEGDPREPLAVYEVRPGIGEDMHVRNAQPAGQGVPRGQHQLWWEEDRFFVEDAAHGDNWMGPLLLAPDRWTLHLDAIEPDGGEATLTVHLLAAVETGDDKKHQIEIQVNGQSAATHAWTGAGPKSVRVPLQAGLLSPDSANSVTVIVRDDVAPTGEAIYLDALELDYTGPIDVSEQAKSFSSTAPSMRIDGTGDDVLIFDVTDPSVPVELVNVDSDGDSVHLSAGLKAADLVALNPESAMKVDLEPVPSWENSLLDPRWGADYIAIVADVRGFNEALAPLLAHRQEQGLRVAAVPLEQIFDEFSHGRRDPEAIKAFIAYATANWTAPAPRYVLLVGDATFDVTDRVAGKNRNRLPTEMVYTEAGGYVASDVSLGMAEDALPQVAIGRFPAQNAPQLRAMVNKTIAYENELDAAERAWAKEALLVADDEPVYTETVAELAEYLEESGYSVYSLHMSQDNNSRHRILSAINQGVGVISYMGEGSEGAWGDEAVFQASDTQGLFNSSRLPILDTFTCRSGSFANPQIDSLAESLLRANNGGIIAAIAPSGHLAQAQQRPLTMLFHQQLARDEPARLGDKLLQMYEAASSSPELADALLPVNLLGDPALQVSGGGDDG